MKEDKSNGRKTRVMEGILRVMEGSLKVMEGNSRVFYKKCLNVASKIQKVTCLAKNKKLRDRCTEHRACEKHKKQLKK